VQVTVDGVTGKLSGRVTMIGFMNTSGTSGTSTTYPVTVLLNPTTQVLYDGARATLAIEVGARTNVLTVPTSAVRLSPIGATVDVYRNGTVTPTRVQTGIRGIVPASAGHRGGSALLGGTAAPGSLAAVRAAPRCSATVGRLSAIASSSRSNWACTASAWST
jgi:hypothetical protein